ncbi:MAG: hypothetical protein U0R24_12185 [Solirubrobacterales bacterium]
MSPVRPLATIAVALLAASALWAGCGGDGGTGGGADGDAVELSRWLPADAGSYSAVDLMTFRDDLDLADDADATGEDLAPYAAPGLAPVFAAGDQDLIAALEPGALTAIASSGGSARPDGAGLSAMATSADTGEIGSALGDMGFREEAGVLVREGSSVAFKLEDGLIFAATDPAALRSLPEEPRDQSPSQLLEDLDAPFVYIVSVPGSGCIRSQAATAEPGGDGEIAWLVDGGADADAVDAQDSSAIEVGEPDVDGDLVTIPVSYVEGGAGSGSGVAARDALGSFQVSYDC